MTNGNTYPTTKETKLIYTRPAGHFAEALPLGNGRLGAMVYGGVAHETITLNENSMWSGSPQASDRPGAHKYLPEITRLLLAGKYGEAEELCQREFTCQGEGHGVAYGVRLPYGSYQTLGRLELYSCQYTSFPPPRKSKHLTGSIPTETMSYYRRSLDLRRAIALTEYDIDGVRFSRECLVSHPDQCIVLRVASDEPGMVSFTAGLSRPERFQVAGSGEAELCMTGTLTSGRAPNDAEGISYACRLRAVLENGRVWQDGTRLYVEAADAVLLMVSAATSMVPFAPEESQDERHISRDYLDAAAAKSWDELERAHVADHQRYFDRVHLSLGTEEPGSQAGTAEPKAGKAGPGTSGAADQADAAPATDERLIAFRKGREDIGLAELAFNVGRYLLIACSRPGNLPANLQGLWAEEVQVPWDGDYHLDLNEQMIYWPAEVCNLAEMHEPCLRLTESLQKPGAVTAQEYYNAPGWVVHVFTNPWGFTSPGEKASWGATTGGAAWLCHHLWQHYAYNPDDEYLARVYPILKGAAEFYLAILVEDPETGRLLTSPSISPENRFYDEQGESHFLSLGATYDMQLVRNLFNACIRAEEILDCDEELRERLSIARDRLLPTRIGSDGSIMEWYRDFKESAPHHRCVSHLWGAFAGQEINPDTTPDLAEAAARTLKKRGFMVPAFAIAFHLMIWSRLFNGEKAGKLITSYLKLNTFPNLFNKHFVPTGHSVEYDGQVTMPEFRDYNHPFQFDGNTGITAGIAEMLLQSHVSKPLDTDSSGSVAVAAASGERAVVLDLLPALPPTWPDGSFNGLRGRGGFTAGVTWRDGKLVGAAIHAAGQSRCVVRYAGRERLIDCQAGETVELDADLGLLES
jgi:alpha-L-fucosidase 2